MVEAVLGGKPARGRFHAAAQRLAIGQRFQIYRMRRLLHRFPVFRREKRPGEEIGAELLPGVLFIGFRRTVGGPLPVNIRQRLLRHGVEVDACERDRKHRVLIEQIPGVFFAVALL